MLPELKIEAIALIIIKLIWVVANPIERGIVNSIAFFTPGSLSFNFFEI